MKLSLVQFQSRIQALKSEGRKLWVLSDIDGTLVPHPYFSGLSAAERVAYVDRLSALCVFPNFAVMTGRMVEGYRRLFEDSGRSLVFPAALGLEFGSLLYHSGKQWNTCLPYAPLQELVADLEAELAKEPAFLIGSNLYERMKSGKMTGFVRELKHQLAQIEWYLDNEVLKRKCMQTVRDFLNQSLLGKGQPFRFQFFENRVDLLQPGFTPKATFSLSDFFGADFDPTKDFVLALGDELYDDHMFWHLKSQLGDRALCASVGHTLRRAHHTFENEADTLDFVESVLGWV